MTQLLKNITNWLKTDKQSELEQFIVKKNPTNPAEVDYWTREYEYRNHRSSNTELWGRGL